MQVVPAEYAFVLHTANPITGAKGEVFGELVQGMGEALVGNHPGRALSFKAGADGVEVKAHHLLPLLLQLYADRALSSASLSFRMKLLYLRVITKVDTTE